MNWPVTITGNDRGWFREAVYFEVEGDDQSIRNFNRQLEASIQAYEENREARKRA